MQMIKNNNLKDSVWQSIADQWESSRVVAALFSAEVRVFGKVPRTRTIWMFMFRTSLVQFLPL